RDQLVFHGLVYVVILPLLSVVFLLNLISWKYIGWFYALLVLEHLSQESYRLMVTLSKPTMASIVLFFRSGAWVYVVVGLMFLDNDLRSLPFIWSGWIVGVLVSIGMTLYGLRHMPWRESRRRPINWTWMKNGLKVSLPFSLATVSFVGIQYADRYFLQHYWGEAMVGVYTFYASISNTIHVFVFTGIIMLLYPRIISAYQQGRLDEYRVLMKKMSWGIIGGVVVLTLGAAALITPVLKLVGKQIYTDHLEIFWIMLASVVLLVIAYIPHYSLFVRKHDKAIVLSAVSALIVGLIANSVLVPRYGLMGAAISSLCSMTILAAVKSWAAWSCSKSLQILSDDDTSIEEIYEYENRV
ncbi:MAG: polysaccharide biosynthesis C-terminal domain-containing protein, partial [candidate division Zixibacteria bacterium]|nr:polysaccharide biosynthesis C-terminal domain-containing protein [candidate division Zixibacteria bacterium]